MSISALPLITYPIDKTVFPAQADAFNQALPVFIAEANATAAAMNTNDSRDTSASSVLIGLGSKSFAVSAGKSFVGGMYLVIAETAAPSTNSMFCQVTSYAGTALVVNCLAVVGSGTKTAWTLSLSGASGALAGASTGPFRNRCINGDQSISQEFAATSTTLTAAAALKYVIDQFYAACTGANVTAQQITGADGRERERFTGAASNATTLYGTRMEAKTTRDMAGSTATLSAKLSSSTLTTVNWAAYYATTADVFGTLAAPIRTSIASGSFTITATEATYSAQMAIPSGATTGIEIVFSTGALVAGATLTYGDVQFEKGAIAPANIVPEVVDIELNRMRCQRYLPSLRSTSALDYLGTFGRILTATDVYFMFQHPVPPRIAPTSIVGSATTHFTVNAATGGGVASAIALASGSTNSSRLQVTSSGMTIGQMAELYFNNSTAYLLFKGCQL